MAPEAGAASPSTMTVSEAGNPGRVRVVRCPKCGLLLPEYAGLELYRCGGCSTPLVAKKQVSGHDNLEKSKTEGPGNSCYPGLPSVGEGHSQIVENRTQESPCTDRISISGDLAASSIMEDGAGITVEMETVASQSERLQTCESPGTPPNKEDNSRRVKAEDSAKLNVESTRVSNDTRSIHKEKISELQTEARSKAKRPQASDDLKASIKEFPSVDPGNGRDKCRDHSTEDTSLVSDMARLSVNSPDYGNRLDEPRVIFKKGEIEKHNILISTPQYVNVGVQDKQLPKAETSDDGFLGSDQRIKVGIKQRKEKTLQVETADGLTYIQQSFKYYGHSKDMRTREKRTPKISYKKDRYSHCNEGPSNVQTSSVADADPNGVEQERQDKEELLRMLDELRDQLSRSHKVKETPNGRHQMNNREDSTNPARSPSLNGWFQERTSTDWSVVEELPKINEQKLNRNGIHLSLPAREKRVDHKEPWRSHVHRRPPNESFNHKPLLASNVYEKGPFLSGPLPSHPHNARLHPSSCLCTHCLNNFHYMPLASALPVSKNNSNPSSAGGHGLPLVENAEVLDAGYGRSARRRYPSVLSNPPNFRKSGPVRRCRSLAGGAPFIICDHCRNLLQLPCDMLMNKNTWKVQCGSCFYLLAIKINGIHLTTTTITPSHLNLPTRDANILVDGLPNQQQLQHVPTDSRQGDLSGTTGEIANANKRLLLSSTPFSANNELVEQQAMSDLNEFKRRERLSLSQGASLGENTKVLHYQRERPKPSHDKDPSLGKSEENLKVSESPVNEKLRYLVSNHPVNSDDIGSQGEHLESAYESSAIDSSIMVKVGLPTDKFSNSTLSRPGGVSENEPHLRHLTEYPEHPQSSPKNPYVSESVHHNIEHETSPQVGHRTDTGTALARKYFSDNRYSDRAFPQKSKLECIDDTAKSNKGARLSFTGLIKKSLKNISHTTESVNSGKCKLFINDHLIPDHLIRKAEQTAGPIIPGSYWYDYEAGFWGVQGQPCLGIIPPNIEEFKFPMKKNCSGGNTSVLINGRELHQTELNLLAERGLPKSRNKSYIVEISGRVFDAESHEELESLGKLAPTVAQLGRGFGMCPLSLI